MNLKQQHALCLVLVTVACAWATGCGSDDGPQMYEVEGTLTHKGKPIPEMTVIFVPEDTTKFPESSAVTDGSGEFVMMCGATKGVAAGPHTVFVQDPGAIHGAKTSDDPAYRAVLAKYGSEEKSPYRITIDDDTDDLELKMD